MKSRAALLLQAQRPMILEGYSPARDDPAVWTRAAAARAGRARDARCHVVADRMRPMGNKGGLCEGEPRPAPAY